MTLSTAALVDLQAIALSTNNRALYHATWIAMGFDASVAFMPVCEGEQQRAMAKCVAVLTEDEQFVALRGVP